MTIIKVTKDGKLVGKKKPDDTVIPLTPDSEPAARTLHISYVPSARSKRVVNIFLLIIALLVLTAGIIGGVYLYKYMQHRHKMYKIQQPYKDYKDIPKEPYALPQDEQLQKDFASSHSQEMAYFTMEEDIQIEETEQVERIEVPQFDECRRSIVLHDFNMNYTAIVDIDDEECFIMELDRKTMSPPKSFAELIRKYSSGYYMPRVDVVRRDYQVIVPPLKDLRFAGPSIETECKRFQTYKLEKKDHLMNFELFISEKLTVKRYGYSDLEHVIKDSIFK